MKQNKPNKNKSGKPNSFESEVEGIKKDKKTDQDFSGYPHGLASEEMINPQSEDEKKSAGLNKKDGEKMLTTPAKKKQIREDESDGTGNAFERTEKVKKEEE